MNNNGITCSVCSDAKRTMKTASILMKNTPEMPEMTVMCEKIISAQALVMMDHDNHSIPDFDGRSVNDLIADVWSDLRRGSTDDAQQSFGDFLRAIGKECNNGSLGIVAEYESVPYTGEDS